MAARERVAEQVANLDDATLDLLREQAHTRRRNLVNLYIGDDRKALIEEEDLIIGVIEEEQAERAGLASSEHILASLLVEDIEVTSEVNGYTVIGTVEAKHVWRAVGAHATKVAFQTGGVHAVTGAPRWAEVTQGQDVTGLDLYEIV